MYPSYLMLRTLAPGEMTGSQQRQADEQLGQLAAALARHRRRVAARAHAIAAAPVRGKRPSAAFRNDRRSRRARAAHGRVPRPRRPGPGS